MNQNNFEQKKIPFSVQIKSTAYQKMIHNVLQEPDRARRFVAAITSAVAANPDLQECTASSILSAALLGESLNLSPSPQLGQYYLVPYKNYREGTTEAQFQIGYRGLLQLALRSGQYRNINVLSVKRGELRHWNPLTEEIDLALVDDDRIREQTETIGYVAFFEYLNGFRKTIYMSRAAIEGHALKYSKSYTSKKGNTFWEKNFDAMARKTMLRQLIQKWGVMSIEMQNALDADKSEEYIPLAAGGTVTANVAPTLPGDGEPLPLEEPHEEKTSPDKKDTPRVSLDDI